MFVEVVRLFVVVLGTAGGFWLARDLGGDSSSLEGLGGMLGTLLGYVGGGIVGRLLEKAVDVVERRVDQVPSSQVVAASLGAVGGGVVAVVAALPLVLLVPLRIGLPLGGLVIWTGTWTGFRVIGRQSAAIFEMLGLSTRPLVRAQPFDARDGFVVDTSVVMDGQLLPLARTGILGSDLLVPRFVLDELQGMADARDGTRARRAQRGLEVLGALKKDERVRLYVLDDEVPEQAEVDAKLVALTRRLELRLLTNDVALGRIADLQGVPVVNLRRLATDLAPAVGPGDSVRVALTRPGREPGQGVGHLDDGSMVVVNDGEDLVGGPEVTLLVTSVVPTSVGRIVFAAAEDASSSG